MTSNDKGKVDFAVFGVTGFTGERVGEYLARKGKRSWCAAGRNPDRVAKVLARIAERVPGFDPATVPIVAADTADDASLEAMAGSAKVVLNLTGPYRFHGAPVVRACVAKGTDYVDVSGEPFFLEKTEFDFDADAKERKVAVVGSAGFDSVPADMGAAFVQSLFPAGGHCSSVESFISIATGRHGFVGHATTFECAVHGIARVAELRKLRKTAGAAAAKTTPAPSAKTLGPPPPRRPMAFRTVPGIGSGWAMHFPGADASVVRRSQRRLAQVDPAHRPARFAAYFTVSSLAWVAVVGVLGVTLKVLSSFSWGRSLMIRFPSFFTAGAFSHDGPSQAQIDDATFAMTFRARGFTRVEDAERGARPDLEIVARVSGPEAGYVATPILMVHAGEVLLEERDSVPHGVLTPALALRNTSYIDRVREDSVVFECLSRTPLEGSKKTN